MFTNFNRQRIKKLMINLKKGKEPVIQDIPIYNGNTLSYNEVHAIQLGLSLGSVLAITHTYHPVLATLILLDLSLTSIGLSIISQLSKLSFKSYAYVLTVRSNPWYFLNSLILTYLVIAFALL